MKEPTVSVNEIKERLTWLDTADLVKMKYIFRHSLNDFPKDADFISVCDTYDLLKLVQDELKKRADLSDATKLVDKEFKDRGIDIK